MNVDIPMSDRKIAQLISSDLSESNKALKDAGLGQLPPPKTAYVNFPPIWERATSAASSTQTRGVMFVCTQSGTVKKIRAKVDTSNTYTYTLAVYEVSPTDRITVTAVAGSAQYTESAQGTAKTLELDTDITLVAGKYYVLAASSTGSQIIIYYKNEGQSFHSAVSATVYEGAYDPARYLSGTPTVGSVFTKGSDYYTVGMSVDY